MLGLDVGSTNVKAVLVLLDVDAATVTEVAVRSAPTPDRAEALVAVVRDLVRAVLTGGGTPGTGGTAAAPGTPAAAAAPAAPAAPGARGAPAAPGLARPVVPLAVGVTSMAETGVPLDAEGRPLTPLLRWDGHRGSADAARLAADVGAVELFAATGVRPSAKVPLVTWHWLRRTEPALWRRVTRWAGAADLVAHALTGRLVTDHTLAGRTMAYRLPPSGAALPDAFDADLLSTVGWTAERVPTIVRPGDPPDPVADVRFVEAGLAAGTPVVVAGHDHAVGTWAVGARRPGDRADSIGTAEAVLTVLDRAAPGRAADRARVAAHGMSLVRTVDGEHEAVLAGSPAAGAMVRWWSDAVLGGRPVADVLPDAPPPGPTGVVVLPYPHGRQSPVPDPAARVRVVDAGGREVPAHRRHTLAMLEGLALQARWMLDVQAELGGRAAGEDRGPLRVLAGAAGANAVWMGLKAAVSGGPLHLVDVTEPVATGAALLAAERAGVVPAGALRLPTRVVVPPADPGRGRGDDGVLTRFVAAATSAPGPEASRATR